MCSCSRNIQVNSSPRLELRGTSNVGHEIILIGFKMQIEHLASRISGMIRDLFNFYWLAVGMLIAEINYRLFIRNRHKLRSDEEDIKDQVVVITGAQRGIGKAAAHEFAKRGATVVLGCLNLKEGESAIAEIKEKTGNNNSVLLHLDLSKMDSVQEFARSVKQRFPKVKILVNNAGIGGALQGNVKTGDGFNLHMAINYLGHFLLTNLIMDNLKRASPSRVIGMSSTLQLLSRMNLNDLMMDKSELGFQAALPYINSKYAITLFTKELGKRVAGSGVHSYAICPGVVKTQIYDSTAKFTQFSFSTFLKVFGFTPEEAAAEFTVHCSLSKAIANDTGKMYRFHQPWDVANERLDDDVAMKLWDISAELVQLEKRKGQIM